MDIATWAREARSRLGLTQEQLSEEIGVSQTLISDWERGVATVKPVDVIALCDRLGASVDERASVLSLLAVARPRIGSQHV